MAPLRPAVGRLSHGLVAAPAVRSCPALCGEPAPVRLLAHGPGRAARPAAALDAPAPRRPHPAAVRPGTVVRPAGLGAGGSARQRAQGADRPPAADEPDA